MKADLFLTILNVMEGDDDGGALDATGLIAEIAWKTIAETAWKQL